MASQTTNMTPEQKEEQRAVSIFSSYYSVIVDLVEAS